jgi:hypothetical protein
MRVHDARAAFTWLASVLLLQRIAAMAKQREWILAPLVALWCGCGSDETPQLIDARDADAVPTDAITSDVPSDGLPDAPPASPEIIAACMHICDRIYECVDMTAPPSCASACAVDLLDCTPQDILDIEACARADCGDVADGIAMCLEPIACFTR